MQLRIAIFAVLLAGTLALAGCGDEDPAPGTVIIVTEHTVDGSTLAMDGFTAYQNATGQTYRVDKLIYYLSDIVLHRSDGGEFRLDEALYNDAADPATLVHRLEQVPSGSYTQITFTWGLKEDKNQPGALPDNPENNNMFWPSTLGGGYHYSKCEGFYRNNPQDAELGYATHTGRVQLMGDPTEHHHYFEVTKAITMHVDGDVWEIPIVMDVNQWYEDPNLYDFPAVPMIMNNLDRQRMLMENGPSAFSIGTVTRK